MPADPRPPLGTALRVRRPGWPPGTLSLLEPGWDEADICTLGSGKLPRAHAQAQKSPGSQQQGEVWEVRRPRAAVHRREVLTEGPGSAWARPTPQADGGLWPAPHGQVLPPAALILMRVQPFLPLRLGAESRLPVRLPTPLPGLLLGMPRLGRAASDLSTPHLSLAALLCRGSGTSTHSCSRPVALREPCLDSRSCLLHLSLLGLSGPPPSAMRMILGLFQMLYRAQAKVKTA